MASPLPSNAIATFTVPGEYSVDSLGNPVAGTTEVTIKIYLKNDGKAQQQQFAGTDNTVRVMGRCIDPIQLPAGVLPGAIAQCTISTPVATLSGQLKLDPSIPSAFGVDAILGQKLVGEFRQFTSYGDAA